MMMSERQLEVHKWPFLRMRSENMAKNCPKCCQIAKICTRWRDFAHAQRAAWSLTQGHTLFCQITPFQLQQTCSRKRAFQVAIN